MGHRALVVYDLPDHYVIAHSHWGAQNLRLEDRITADSLRAGAYPERGLLGSVAETMTDKGEIEEVTHVGGNQGSKDVEPPTDAMEKPCSLGDVFAQQLHGMYEAVYVADVEITQARTPLLRRDCFEEIARHVDSVDVTGYHVIGLPTFDESGKHSEGLEPDVIIYRGDREIGNKLARQSFNMREQVDEGVFSPGEAVEVAATQMANTVYDEGGWIPEWSPVGGDLDRTPQTQNTVTAAVYGVAARISALVT